MANVKVTKRDRFNQLLAIEAVASNEELVNFIEHELELLDKKSSNRKPTKTQKANEALKATILEVLGDNKPMTVTEVLATGVFPTDTSNQKISAMLRQLVESGQVAKTVDKKVSRFSVA